MRVPLFVGVALGIILTKTLSGTLPTPPLFFATTHPRLLHSTPLPYL